MKEAINKLVGVVTLFFALAPSCYAQVVTAQYKVTATITNGCIFNDSTPITVNLPELLIGGDGVKAPGTFQLTCTPDMSAGISIDDGEHVDKSGGRNLAMDNKSNILIPYQIYYVDSGQKKPWNRTITLTPAELSKVINFEVDVPQPVTSLYPGHYSDTDIITVSY